MTFCLVKMKMWILSNSPCQNCTSFPCLAPGQSFKDIRFWGLPFRSKLFHFQNFRGDGACKCTWHTIPPGRLRLRKCSRFFWLLFPSFLTEEEDLLWREDLLSSFERHNMGWQHGARVSWQPKMHHYCTVIALDSLKECQLILQTCVTDHLLQSPQFYTARFVFFPFNKTESSLFVKSSSKIHHRGHSVERVDKRWHGLGGYFLFYKIHSVERDDKGRHGLGGYRRLKVSPGCFKAPHPGSKSSQIQFRI